MAICAISGLEGIRIMTKEAAFIAAAIVIAGFLVGGRFETGSAGAGATIYRLDRWTGAMTVCGGLTCRTAVEPQ